MNILPADPRANYLAHQEEIDAAIRRVLESGRYILGPEVTAFEEEFAAFVEREGAAGVASGTEAIVLALMAAGIEPGDAVVTVSQTAVATVAAIEMAGGVPILVDIDPATYTMDPNLLAETLRASRARAVLPVHLYGHPADMPAIVGIAREHGAVVIEDCAQAHGARLKGKPVGSWGEAAFSFYPTKNLGALGDGGAVAGDRAFVERVKQVREYGWGERFVSDFPGINSRLDELQAAVLRVKLGHLSEENSRRKEIASLYEKGLGETSLVLPAALPEAEHVFHLYVVRTPRRESLRAFLAERGVGTGIHYPAPVHLQPAYAGRIAAGAGGLLHTEQVCSEVLSLPMHPALTDNDVRRISQLIVEWDTGRDE